MADKELYQLTISINKALNPMETPLKMKHARSIIIRTHHTKEAKSFWKIMTRQHLMENRFTAWKFCHLLHKVLREGHPSAIRHSLTHKKMILEIGKLWGHLQDGVGNCIEAYTKLLVTKLDFHVKNSLFPGTLLIDFSEIEKHGGPDINLYFQLAVEIFDYIDDIIDVETKVFAAVNTYRMSSMTPQGQCRLAPLITLIQDSNPLYDVCVRLMFKLHKQLPNDLVSGHRERFEGLFYKLKQFYDSARPLQYFADLIQVPHLPDHVPNFCSQVDFGTYIPPVVLVQPDPEPILDQQLIDTNIDVQSSDSAQTVPTVSQEELKQTIQDREQQLHNLQCEVANMRDNVRILQENAQREQNILKSQLLQLNSELNEIKATNQTLTIENETLNKKLAETTPDLLNEQEKIKTTEEKFNKLKIMYAQIRDDHIPLLREHSELKKNYTQNNELIEHLKTELQLQTNVNRELEELKKLNAKQEELYKEEILQLQMKNSTLSTNETELQAYLDLCKKQKHELDAQNMEIEKLKKQHTHDLEEVRNLIEREAALKISDYFSVLCTYLGEKVMNNEKNSFEEALKSIEELEKILPELCNPKIHFDNKLNILLYILKYLNNLKAHGIIINNTIADINGAEQINKQIHSISNELKEHCLVLNKMKVCELLDAGKLFKELKAQLKQSQDATNSKLELGDLVNSELSEMDKVINEAAERFVQMLSETREKEEGIKLEVNGKILDACTTLMEFIKQLIERSRALQAQIVKNDRGSISAKEYYNRNSQWTEGLISAAKSVAKAANLLLNAADKATSDDAPATSQNFPIIVAAQEIAASTAQLVVASQVKAPKDSPYLNDLKQASRNVSLATGAIVATVRDCNKYLEPNQQVDITKLNSSQAKTMEMEIHIRVLELEHLLETERLKLSSFRRNNYQNTED